MIYEVVPIESPIRQGDIFRGLPKATISLMSLSILNAENESEAVRWEDLRESPEPITAVVGLTPATGIVITQDCDTVRAPEISLCEIKPLSTVVGDATQPKNAKKWVEFLRRHTIQNLKWFYLPPDPRVGFAERMAVEFQSVLQVPRDELEQVKHFRVGRLNSVGDEHFRERLAEFFRRYPYDEWYSYNKDEFQAYREMYPDATPFEHQQ